jgi:GNAT superfamily N-acetyltransferase
LITYRIADENDLESLMNIRLEMLRVVNNLSDEYRFTDEFICESRAYFQAGSQTTVLAMDDLKVIGCASICYIRIMPTFSHPSGNRAHLMNVYTSEGYRRKGIAKEMVSILIADAWKRGSTEIGLDASETGRPFYENLGFVDSDEHMVLVKER